MGTAVKHALGRNQRFYAEAETSFGTYVAPTSNGAMKVTKSSMSFKQTRKDRSDSRQTRSVLERITGKQEVAWSCSMYALPSGAAGTAPDCDQLMKAALGVKTVNASTNVIYSMSAAQEALGSLSVTREFNGVIAEAVYGAWVEQMTAKLDGGNEVMLEFQGGASGHINTGTSTLNGAALDTATSVTVQTADVTQFQNGSYVQVGTSTGHLVTAGGGTASLTISPGLSGDQDDGAAVIPYVPTETTSGSPIAGIVGSLTIDGTTVPITAAEVTLKNNIKAVSNEFGSELAATDYIPSFREVTGSISIRVRKDLVIYISKRKGFTTRDLSLTAGGVSGKKLKIDIDYAEFEFSDVEAPEADECTIQLPFKALGGTGEGEVTYTWL